MSLPISVILVVVVVIFTLMFGIFTLPSLAAVFKAVDSWKKMGSKSYFIDVFKTWISEIPNLLINFILAILIGLAILLFRLLDGNVVLQTILLVWGLFLISFTISQSFLRGTGDERKSLIKFTFANLGRAVAAAIVFTIFIMVNGFLKLAFLMLICSVSLSAVISYSLLKKSKITNFKN
ncbi:hypothetical protein IV79_GL000577 [Pediococcus claussenii]|nr:hypothetical protein IV79_GL000577 [Pediococcus claussenii]